MDCYIHFVCTLSLSLWHTRLCLVFPAPDIQHKFFYTTQSRKKERRSSEGLITLLEEEEIGSRRPKIPPSSFFRTRFFSDQIKQQDLWTWGKKEKEGHFSSSFYWLLLKYTFILSFCILDTIHVIIRSKRLEIFNEVLSLFLDKV